MSRTSACTQCTLPHPPSPPTTTQGGFGTVRAVTDVLTGVQYACKTVRKRLDVPNVSVAQQAKHIDNLKREISILRKLRGTLSVVHFKGAYEDEESVHIVMEYCRGGELHHRIGKREYNEKTVGCGDGGWGGDVHEAMCCMQFSVNVAVAHDYCCHYFPLIDTHMSRHQNTLSHTHTLTPTHSLQVQRIMKCCMFTLAQCHSHNILHRDIKPGNFMWLTDEEDSPVKALGM